MEWTPLDLKNLAVLFDDMADAVLAYRKQKGDSLTVTQKLQLTTEFGQLVSCGEDLENMALVGALANVQTDVKDLQNASHDAIQALHTIDTVQKAISISVAAAAVGAAIVSASPGAIGPSLVVLVQIINDARTSTAAGVTASNPVSPATQGK